MPDTFSIERFADWLAHYGLSEFAKACVPIPNSLVTRSAVNDAMGVSMVITIAKIDKEPYRCIVEPAQIAPSTSKVSLTESQQAVVDSLDDKPRKAALLAMKLKRPCSGSFRGMLADLVRFGAIKKVKGGYVKPTI